LFLGNIVPAIGTPAFLCMHTKFGCGILSQ
jgi:hypothetical protein